MGRSKILIIGATGTLGQELVKSSLSFGHPTFALVRDETLSDSIKSQIIHSFSLNGVSLLKRFIPSEFGADPYKVQIRHMDYGFYEKKAEVRRLIEKEGIPHTFVSCNLLMRYLLPSLVQPGFNSPPRDKLKIYGDGNTEAVFVKDCDVAAFTIRAVDDPRTLNKVLYLRPPENIVSMNELSEMWQTKIGKKLEKVYISEEQLLKSIQETSFPSCMELIFVYYVFIKGDHTYFSIESSGLYGTQLYPDVKYTTVSEFLDTLL